VAHRIAALEPRVARGTLVLGLQRRAQEGVREHTRHTGGRERDKARAIPRGAKAAVNPEISAAPATPPSVPRAVIPPEVPRVTLPRT